MTQLPQDDLGKTIQSIGLRDGAAHQVTTSAVSAKNATAFNSETQVVLIYADQDCYIKLSVAGDAATATDHFIPANTYITLSTNKALYIAALQVSAAGTLYISEAI